MEPTWTLNPDALTVESFTVQTLDTPTRSETGCIDPCHQDPIWP